jgi:hypothetical protein
MPAYSYEYGVRVRRTAARHMQEHSCHMSGAAVSTEPPSCDGTQSWGSVGPFCARRPPRLWGGGCLGAPRLCAEFGARARADSRKANKKLRCPTTGARVGPLRARPYRSWEDMRTPHTIT